MNCDELNPPHLTKSLKFFERFCTERKTITYLALVNTANAVKWSPELPGDNLLIGYSAWLGRSVRPQGRVRDYLLPFRASSHSPALVNHAFRRLSKSSQGLLSVEQHRNVDDVVVIGYARDGSPVRERPIHREIEPLIVAQKSRRYGFWKMRRS